MVAKDSCLARILEEAREYKSLGQPLLAVFDLDSTLFDLTLRVAKIVDSFAADPVFRNRFPFECAELTRAEILRTDWGIGESLNRIGLTEAKHREFYHELHRYWALHFFSNSYLHHDEPLPGAVSFVCRLAAIGAHIVYLTGRDVARMQEGTERSLRESGFPVEGASPGAGGCAGVNVRTVLKPSADMDDARFKVDFLKNEMLVYKRIWLFENEPVNLNLAASECPEIQLVFIDSVHSGRQQLASTLNSIKHFEVDAADFATE